MFSEVTEYRIEGKMVQVSMLCPCVVVKVNEVFYVIVRADKLNILLRAYYWHAYYLLVDNGYVGSHLSTILYGNNRNDGNQSCVLSNFQNFRSCAFLKMVKAMEIRVVLPVMYKATSLTDTK